MSYRLAQSWIRLEMQEQSMCPGRFGTLPTVEVESTAGRNNKTVPSLPVLRYARRAAMERVAADAGNPQAANRPLTMQRSSDHGEAEGAIGLCCALAARVQLLSSVHLAALGVNESCGEAMWGPACSAMI
jgi:hypothetical protein